MLGAASETTKEDENGGGRRWVCFGRSKVKQREQSLGQGGCLITPNNGFKLC